MIPLKLTLRNFMSYGEEPTTLDFRGMHVACLSGDNGHGKSALLDAITYALWGCTRASGSAASREDDVVRVGADSAEVVLEFELERSVYRACRRRSRTSHSGEWRLDLQGPEGEWKPVGGASMGETGRHLQRLLRMEYETFLNSAYLRQGHADEFTRQKPSDRKRILADILDLSRYDKLADMARQRRMEAELTVKELDGELRLLGDRARQAPALREELMAAQAEMERRYRERDERAREAAAERSALAVLEEKAARLAETEQRLAEFQAELARARQRQAAILEGQRAAHEILARREQIESDYRRFQDASRRAEELEPATRALREAQSLLQDAQGRLALRRQELAAGIRAAEIEADHARERARQIENLQRRLEELAPKLVEAEKASADLRQAQEELQEAQERYAQLAAANESLGEAIALVESRLSQLEQPLSTCPVCLSDLTQGRREQVVERLRGDRQSLVSQRDAVRRDGTQWKLRREERKSRVSTLEARTLDAAGLRGVSEECRSSLEALIAQQAASSGLEERLADLRKQMKEERYGAEEREEIAALERRCRDLASDAARHDEARREVRELAAAGIEARWAGLREAEREAAWLEAEAESILQEIARWSARVDEERARTASLGTDLARIAEVRARATAAEERLRMAAQAAEEAARSAERARGLLEDAERAAEAARQKQMERDRADADRQAYADLFGAFGKRGVQALIIDNVLPEIQDEANRLLARMTDNGMQVGFSTLRKGLTAASQIETLDITITDDAGTRPYELYSGGEAFRVNFAIRISLSRLLSRRAGAQLRTLIIDEGFGTQDAKGRDRLVEAIESVKDEFALILVVSHVEDLKDAFPTRIEVTKTPSGSRLTLV